MGVNIQRHTDSAMPQYLLHDLGMHTHTQQNRRCTVTQIMEPYIWQFRALQKPFKIPMEINSIQVVTIDIAEYDILFSPQIARLFAHFLLMLLVSLESLNHKSR